ncbi:tail protein [Pseudomonas phage PMBT14]|uniref:Tail protein n=1 Tax=Pseudomonas phage PMBT14 TaxID=2059855 RepID=A0A2I6PI52_9CAUD|nr:minor tail protein [Pseudomonas phage PMBT14]AUM59738.1 tail protein [Pseudomonas phage PMBT14]UOL48383.1 tail protein [Pseudomonas phage Almagne]
MKASTQSHIDQHIISEYPNEACGLLLKNGSYFPCKNVSATPLESFRIAPEQYAEAEDISPVVGVVHSHPNWSSLASEGDRVSCENLGLPWHIYSVNRNDSGELLRDGYSLINPCGYKSPLVGRKFLHGTLDCLQVVLDYYQWEKGIDLGQYEREDDWWNNGQNLYLELLPKAGFVRLKEDPEEVQYQDGDVILMQIRSPVPNHAAIYLADGTLKSQPDLLPTPGSILHHVYGRDSSRDVYGGYWLKNTVSVWRHHG